MEKSRCDRRRARLNPTLDAKLIAYIAAAGASSVGVLTLNQSAEAKVVYTPANTHIALDGSVPIDLNHDGVVDFSLVLSQGYGGQAHWLNVLPQVSGNAVRSDGGAAAAGFFGLPVGPGEKFATNSFFGRGVFMAFFSSTALSTASGPWANASNRYLGLKFLINGQTHFGWARVTVGKYVRNVVLTGYAYETEPNTSIIEGHISDSGASLAMTALPGQSSQPASLDMLARGADVLAVWRREDELAA
jgi:hypothetical protein